MDLRVNSWTITQTHQCAYLKIYTYMANFSTQIKVRIKWNWSITVQNLSRCRLHKSCCYQTQISLPQTNFNVFVRLHSGFQLLIIDLFLYKDNQYYNYWWITLHMLYMQHTLIKKASVYTCWSRELIVYRWLHYKCSVSGYALHKLCIIEY